MAFEEGVIESTSPGKARIRLQRKGACTGCNSRQMCHVASLEEMVIEVDNDLGAQAGDRVEITLPTGSLLKLSLLVYFLPVVAMLTGAYLGSEWAAPTGLGPTGGAAAGGAAAFIAAFWGLKRLDRAAGITQNYRPQMTRILTKDRRPLPADNK